MKQKHSKALLVSAILGTLYSIYLISHWADAILNTSGGLQSLIMIAMSIFIAHIISLVLATIFNWVSYITNKRGFALTAGILYLVAGIVFLPYIIFVILSIVLSFVGYVNLKKINETNKIITTK
ncbi:hypothetical protein [Clostridium sardiniense]|uniref:hypothetical protein n=1 Tax=Clostridium sardiniense TaxID=29369 RepID=UPI0019587447|nr:hypothetical protein [Clostridium sardiniense]MBM7835909.1 magnesium-transporting ATPase (P-type) [Clostridium sardiniense]